MTDAAPTDASASAAPAAGEAAGAPRRPRAARWMDTTITLLVAGALGAVLFVATPPLLRAAGVGATPQAAIGSGRGAARPARNQPRFFHDDDPGADERDDDPLRAPGWPRAGGDDDRAPLAEPGPSHADGGVRLGLVRRGIKLFDQPDDTQGVTGEVGRGEVVMLVKDVGDWVLVVHSDDDGMAMGWTRKSEIAVR